MPEKNYKVEKKIERFDFDSARNPVTVFDIWAFSKGGTYFHVRVPESELARADELLTKKAAELDAIK